MMKCATMDVDNDLLDDDIFALNQVKPVNNLTLRQASLVRHKVVHSVQSKNVLSVESTKHKNAETKNNLKKRTVKAKQNSGNSSKFTNNTILSYWTPVEDEKSPKKAAGKKECDDIMTVKIFSEREIDRIYHESCEGSLKKEKNNIATKDIQPDMCKKNESECLQLSPGISKNRKRFSISENQNTKTSPLKLGSPVKKCKKTNEFESVKFSNSKGTLKQNSPIDKTESKQKAFIPNLKSKDYDEKNLEDNGDLLCFLLKNMITEITDKLENLKAKCAEDGRITENLVSTKDNNILQQFCILEGIYCKAYVRVLCRSKQWYRLSTLSFKDVNQDLKPIFEILHQKNLVDVNIEEENLKIQMELLSKAEIQELCKLFKFPVKSSNSLKKLELIDKLIESSQSQRSVVNMFNQRKNSLIDLLQIEVTKCLGPCIRINEAAKSTMNKILLLFSFPHYFDEEEKRFRSQLYMLMNAHKGFIRFPSYKLSPTVVFETLDDFEQFSAALELRESFYAAEIAKQYEEFYSVSRKVKKEFKKILNDEKYKERYMRLQPFLKRFNAGHIYARLLTKFCTKFKTKTSNTEIINIGQMLLTQNLFLTSKRGNWYEILSQALESTKNSEGAAEILIQAQSDPHLNDVQKLTLQLRGQALLKKKKNGIEKGQVREILSEVCTVTVQEPKSIEIKGKALEGNKSGYKSVYVEYTNDGKMYTSVEERALIHYKKNGFTKGCHVEGYIIQSLYALLFFDIIYELSPPGVFQSAYQEIPLDFYTNHFYINRKTSIDLRLEEMLQWTEEEADNKIKTVYYNNFNTSCIISWKEHFTPEVFCEVMKCITLPVLANIFKRILKNFKVAQVGFPDLTLWNPETKQCKFAEVKSPNDKLSPAQRVWLDFLRNLGIDCEVCNVKNISRKLLL